VFLEGFGKAGDWNILPGTRSNPVLLQSKHSQHEQQCQAQPISVQLQAQHTQHKQAFQTTDARGVMQLQQCKGAI